MSKGFIIVCSHSWAKVTADRILGPYPTREDAEAVMPYAVATFPRAHVPIDPWPMDHINYPWPIWSLSDPLMNLDHVIDKLKEFGVIQ